MKVKLQKVGSSEAARSARPERGHEESQARRVFQCQSCAVKRSEREQAQERDLVAWLEVQRGTRTLPANKVLVSESFLVRS